MAADRKSVNLEFFAQFREDRGVSRETVRTSSRTAAELYEELDSAYRFRTERAVARVAVNDKIVPWDTSIDEGDTVVFLTPFGGG